MKVFDKNFQAVVAILMSTAPGLAWASGNALVDCQAVRGSGSDMELVVNAQRQLHLTQTLPTVIDIKQDVPQIGWSCGWYRLTGTQPVSFQLFMDEAVNDPGSVEINGQPVNIPLYCVGNRHD